MGIPVVNFVNLLNLPVKDFKPYEKSHQIWADFNESEAISKGVYNAYVQNNLRYSRNAPLSMFEEKNTG
jgi:hypothetical protein